MEQCLLPKFKRSFEWVEVVAQSELLKKAEVMNAASKPVSGGDGGG